MAKVDKDTQQRELLEELKNEFEAVPKILLNNNGPDDSDLINTVTNGSIIEIEKVLKERDAYSQEALNKSLMIAAVNGQKEILILLLKGGADANWTDKNGNTSLMVCAEKGFVDMAKLLLAKKADAKKINTSGNTALILSIKPSGDAEITSLLVSSSNVNVKNHEGQTALSKAVDSGDPLTIHILILYGADQNDVINGETIQELAAKNGMLPYIEIALECTSFNPPFIVALKYRDLFLLETILTYESSDINQTTFGGSTALEAFFDTIIKAKKGFTSLDKSIVEFLITRGETLKPDKYNIRRLYCDQRILVKAVQIGDLDIVRRLCIQGSQVNEQGNHVSLTPLSMASYCGFAEITKYLLSMGADFKVEGNEGTALDIAVKYGHLDCAKILLEEKAKTEFLEAYKFAIRSKYLCLVEHLDKLMFVSKDNIFLKWGIESGKIEIFQYLINQVKDVNESINLQLNSTSKYPKCLSPLHIAVIKKEPDFIKVLLQSKADINIKDSEGNTPLFYALDMKSSDMVNKILEYSSCVNSKMVKPEPPVCYYNTPYLCVKECRGPSVEIVSLLVEWKADTSTIAKNGGTYITELLRSGSSTFDCQSETWLEALQILLKERIDINKQDDDGDTALMIACNGRYCMTEAVKLLLEHGANVNLVNNKNENALSLSLLRHNVDITKMLLQKKAKFYPLTLCQQGVHLLVTKNEAELISLALGNGVFPFVVKAGMSGYRIFCSYHMFTSDLSPLLLALYENRLDLATYLIQVRFLTKFDVTDLIKKEIFQKACMSVEQGTIFDNLLSLYTLSFVQISEMLGATLDREEKVNQLPLPQKVKQQLLFRSL